MKHVRNFSSLNEGLKKDLRIELNNLIISFNDEKNLELKLEKAQEIKSFLGSNDKIKGVDDEFLWEVFNTYIEHLGAFATAAVYYGKNINDGIEMVDQGYIFDNNGFEPFEG